MKATYACLSAKTRRKLYVVVMSVSMFSIVLCLLYLVMVLYSFQLHRFLLHDLIISLFDDLYMNLIPLGVLMILLNLVAFKINRNLKKQPINHSLPRTHRVWVALLLMTLLAMVLSVAIMIRVNNIVDSEVGPRLKHGLTHYADTPSWGHALDRIQKHLECCGVHGPSDWYNTAWIPLSLVAGHNVDNKLVQPTGRVQVPVVPSSCCRTVSAGCGLHAWLETKTRSWADIRPAEVSQVWTLGCEHAIRSTVARDLLVFKLILAVVFVLQVVLVVVARYLHTSSINAAMLGRPKDPAPGWLVGPRLLGKKRYGYLQVYDDRCHNIESEDLSEDTASHRKKWKCLSKMKRIGRSQKGTDSEGSESSGGRSRFKSPCLTKLKKSYSKRFGKKPKIGDYATLESDTAAESEPDDHPEEEDTKRKSVSFSGNSPKRSKESPRNSPERMRTGGDGSIEVISMKSGITTKKKISGNLIDIEVAAEESHTDVLDTSDHLIASFLGESSVGRKSIPNSPKSDGKRKVRPVFKPKKQLSAVVDDFKRRRDLFERSSKNEKRADFSKSETVHIHIPPPFSHPVNLIDLDAVESAKSLSVVETSSVELTVAGSVKKEAQPRPALLRNYPPLLE